MKLKREHITVLFLLYVCCVIYYTQKMSIKGPKIDVLINNSKGFPTSDVWQVSDMLSEFRTSKSKQKRMELLSIKRYKELVREKCPNFNACNTFCRMYDFTTPTQIEQIKPRLFWGTIFNNEIDILEIALHEMIDYIHSFTIIEANVTFTGKPRELNFPKYASRLLNYSHKINYVPWHQKSVDEVYFHAELGEAYGREEAIRNSIKNEWIKQGILHLPFFHHSLSPQTDQLCIYFDLYLGIKPTDLAIVADADEFVNRDFLTALTICKTFKEHTDMFVLNKTQHNTQQNTRDKESKKRKPTTLSERCHKKTKIMARINQFSSYVDCPQISQYGAVKEILEGE
jgi:hypothetical protein